MRSEKSQQEASKGCTVMEVLLSHCKIFGFTLHKKGNHGRGLDTRVSPSNVLIGSLGLLCSEEAVGEQKEVQGYVS